MRAFLGFEECAICGGDDGYVQYCCQVERSLRSRGQPIFFDQVAKTREFI